MRVVTISQLDSGVGRQEISAMLNFSRVPSVPFVKAVEKIRVALDYAKKRTFPAPIALLEVVTSHWISQAVIVAAELDVAGHLKAGPLSIVDLAKKVNADEESLYRVLRLLAGVGIFVEEPVRVFALNELSRPLLKDAPDSVHGMVLMNGRAFHWNAWGELRRSVQTGRAAVELQQGKSLFDFLSENPEDSGIFDDAMSGWAVQSANIVAELIDFTGYDVIADIGGGNGKFLSQVLLRHPNARGLLFDQHHVVEGAKRVLDGHGLSQRCEVQSGSFFDFVPEGADAYILKNILHDWSDEISVGILSRIRQAMKPTSRLFIVESVIPENGGYHVGKLIDLEMLVCTPGGKERTERQFRDLFAASRLKLVRVHPLAAIESVVEVAPADLL